MKNKLEQCTNKINKLYGSHVLKDNEGAEAEYKLMNNKRPAINPNANIPKGDVHSGWNCWTKPFPDYKPETIILKPIMSNSRYVTLKLK